MTDEELKLYSHPKMQEFFRQKMGLFQDGDQVLYNTHVTYWCEECGDGGFFSNEFMKTKNKDELIRLPLPIDPINPERGLWGMIETKTLYLLSPRPSWPYYSVRMGNGDAVTSIDGETPTLALLRALAHQLEVEE